MWRGWAYAIALGAFVATAARARRRDDPRRGAEERLRSLAEAIPQAVWIGDATGEIEYANRALLETTGAAGYESFLGTRWLDHVHPDDRAAAFDALYGALGSGRPAELEHRLRMADGSYRWFLSRLRPMRDRSGAIVSWFGTSVDAEERRARRAAEEERDRSVAALRDALEARERFLELAAHELRTPLTALTMQLQHLERLAEREGERLSLAALASKVRVARRQAMRLSALTEQLLLASATARGALEVRPETVDAAAVAREAIRDAQVRAGQRLTLRLRAPRRVPVRVDPLALRGVLEALLDNACKFGRGLPVDVALGPVPGGVRASVRDQGIGIPPADLERVFSRFGRAVATRHFGGLGLGLFLAKSLAMAHGGWIRAEHAPTAPGSVLTFTLAEVPLLDEGCVRSPGRAVPSRHG